MGGVRLGEMEHQKTVIRDFMFQKFSTDKRRKRMRPATGADWVRAEISWFKFYMDDVELETVVDAVMYYYVEMTSHS